MVPETAASFILSDFEPYTDVCAKYCKDFLGRIKGKTKALALEVEREDHFWHCLSCFAVQGWVLTNPESCWLLGSSCSSVAFGLKNAAINFFFFLLFLSLQNPIRRNRRHGRRHGGW